MPRKKIRRASTGYPPQEQREMGQARSKIISFSLIIFRMLISA